MLFRRFLAATRRFADPSQILHSSSVARVRHGKERKNLPLNSHGHTDATRAHIYPMMTQPKQKLRPRHLIVVLPARGCRVLPARRSADHVPGGAAAPAPSISHLHAGRQAACATRDGAQAPVWGLDRRDAATSNKLPAAGERDSATGAAGLDPPTPTCPPLPQSPAAGSSSIGHRQSTSAPHSCKASKLGPQITRPA